MEKYNKISLDSATEKPIVIKMSMNILPDDEYTHT